MRKLIAIVLLCCAVILVGGNAWALPSVGDSVLMSAGSSYPYTLTDLDDNIVYDSFCLERTEYFVSGNEYVVQSVEDYATSGGSGAVDGKDYVSSESKALYVLFATGVIDQAFSVQYAIWYLEGEITCNYYWNRLYSNYLSSFNGDYSSILSGWQIAAINLIDEAGNPAQSQLVGERIAQVPEPATMLLLGTGLIGLAGVGRKRIVK